MLLMLIESKNDQIQTHINWLIREISNWSGEISTFCLETVMWLIDVILKEKQHFMF